jgi:hypothetical protein
MPLAAGWCNRVPRADHARYACSKASAVDGSVDVETVSGFRTRRASAIAAFTVIVLSSAMIPSRHLSVIFIACSLQSI